MNLDEAQERWISLYRELAKDPNLDHARFAAPFLSVPPTGYSPEQVPCVLYIGKATRGDWYRARFKKHGSRDERRRTTAKLIHRWVKPGTYRPGFWSFACRVSEVASRHATVSVEPLQNLVWSNIAKIGTVTGNPEGQYLAAQRQLAVETLKLEIATYRPALLLFVSGVYSTDIVHEVTAPLVGGQWHRQREQEGFWWRDATPDLPAVLWTYHPERKPLDTTNAWLEKADEML